LGLLEIEKQNSVGAREYILLYKVNVLLELDAASRAFLFRPRKNFIRQKTREEGYKLSVAIV
jgi:hypothetical protein